MTLPPQPAIVTADLFDLHHGRVDVVDLQFRAFGRSRSFFGPCATMTVFEDHTPVLAALASPGGDRVLVVDGGGSLRVGLMGDRLAEIGVKNGWRGVVINGAIRDSAGIDALSIGVRALGTTARRAWSPTGLPDFGPVVLGGVEISPADWVYADPDAVMVARSQLALPAQDE